jgi:hypothetical protein
LRIHLIINLCRNVVLEGLALGEKDAESNLYVVEEWAAGCNDWLAKRKFARVDFVVDVEGAELGTLRGAAWLLERRPQPIILAEVQDVRTLPSGYAAKQIIVYLINKVIHCLACRKTAQGQAAETALVPAGAALASRL